jgi:hypothetical protein
MTIPFSLEKTTRIIRVMQLNSKLEIRPKKKMIFVVQSFGKDFIASFVEANQSMSGSTSEEAVKNLKDIIASNYYLFLSHDKTGTLSRGLKKQLITLQKFIRIRT